MSSTNPTATHSTSSAGRTLLTICSPIGTSRTLQPRSESACCSARRRQMARSSAVAAATPVPGRRRPMAIALWLPRSWRTLSGSAIGTHISGSAVNP
jgi:hypothetical protein